MHPIHWGFALLLAFLGHSHPAFAANDLLANPHVVQTVHDWIRTSRCTEPVNQLLSDWKSLDQWVGSPPQMDGGKLFRTPTQKIGVWIQLTFYPDHTVEANRISAHTSTQVLWGQPNCIAQLRTQVRKPSSVTSLPEFSDQTLEAVLKAHSKGLIFAWSPHMPLSSRGYAEAKAMAAKLHLEFVPVLDPSASLSAAQDTAKKKHFDSQSLRRITSMELLARGINQHYPCVIVFSGNQITSPVYPGYWDDPEILEAFLKKHLP